MPRPYILAALVAAAVLIVYLVQDRPPACESVTVKASEVDVDTEAGRRRAVEIEAMRCDRIVVEPD